MDPADSEDAQILAAHESLQERMARAGWLETSAQRGDVVARITTPLGSARLHFLRTAFQELGYSEQDTGGEWEARVLLAQLFCATPFDLPPRSGDNV